MEMTEYLEKSARTAVAFDEMAVNEYTYNNLKALLEGIVSLSNRVDEIKKHMFYGKAYADAPDLGKAAHLTVGPVEADLIHGIVGKVTESSELAEVLLDILNNVPYDRINIEEEVGDGMWYDAMILRALESNFERCGDVNINKLAKRFPDKFTGDHAINRDTSVEREQMEKDINSYTTPE